MIQIRNLSVRYQKHQKYALSQIDLSFKKGEFVCVLGKSGAGKSTFIRCVNGLQIPTSGSIIYHETDLKQCTIEQRRKIRREMGMVFQHFHLIPRMTVIQNVLTGYFGYRSSMKNLLGIFSKEELIKAEQALIDVELTHEYNRRVEELSGGQMQRVGIARVIVQQPNVLLGDEPVASLDPGTSKRIFQLLKKIHVRHELLTIMNVHDIRLAKQYATRILALREGKLIFDGKPEEFTEDVFNLTYSMN